MKVCRTCNETKPKTDFYRNHGKCKPCYASHRREHESRHPKTLRRYRLNSRYGLTPECVRDLLREQGDVCAICAVELTVDVGYNDAKPVGVVDHNHRTGAVRGVLCQSCNLMLGKAYDGPEVLERAAEYLRQHEDRYGVTRDEEADQDAEENR